MFPDIDAKDVGTTGLVWLFLSYGYILFVASNLISEGSDLLLLIPSLAGLVGGVVLPLLGAIPDGAIMLFSGLGEKEAAQETLAVGVGALAGSTIMLLTVPWFLSVFAGRVDLITDGTTMRPNYSRHPKLTKGRGFVNELSHTGVALPEEVRNGAVMMMLTTIPYFLIQIPASFLTGRESTEEVAADEKWWSFAAFAICIIGFVTYMYIHVQKSNAGAEKIQRIAVMKRLLGKGKVSLSGALADAVISGELAQAGSSDAVEGTESQVLIKAPPPKVKSYLKELLREPFQKYDQDQNGTLERDEMRVLLRDFSETISEEEVDELFSAYDGDGDGTISFDEFIVACYSFIAKNVRSEHTETNGDGGGEVLAAEENGTGSSNGRTRAHVSERLSSAMLATNEDEEEEDVPEDLSSLSPEQQQKIVKRRAFFMLTAGTALVAIFSDPMVEVVQEISNRVGIPPFYVSFMLAPLAANASEVIASQFYAAKKTRKTITVSFSALEGAASMNNTFCLSIFMGLIFVRGLAWQYTAETIAIVVVQFIVGTLARREVMTTGTGLAILSIFPLSVAFVATLEALGFD